MYCAAAWNSNICHDMAILETIQRLFTKKISSLKFMPYSDQLNEFDVLSLQHQSLFTDLLLTYKFIHGLIDVPAHIKLNYTLLYQTPEVTVSILYISVDIRAADFSRRF